MTFNLAFWLSLALAGLGCTGLVLAGRGMWQGWALGLAAQPVWAAFAIVSKGYGLLLTCGMYGTVYWRNLAKWRRQNADRSPACAHSFRSVVFRNGVQIHTCTSCGDSLPSRPSPVVGSRYGS